MDFYCRYRKRWQVHCYDKERITDKAITESGIRAVPAHTVIMSFKLSIGKTAITSEEMYTNEAIMAFVSKGTYDIDTDYLYHLCCGTEWTEGTNKAVMGLTLNKATLSEKRISLPEITEQRNIAAKFDALDNVIEKTQSELSSLDQLVKSRFVEMFGDLLTKAKYPKRQISDLGIVGTGNTPSMRVSEYYESEDIPFIKPGDIAESGVTIVSNADTAYISESARKAARIMPYNTVMVTCIGTIGKVGIVQRESACNQQINYIIPNALINSMYLAQCLSFYKPVLEEMANAPVVPIINKTQFSTVALPVPPLELQNHFAAFVAEVDKSKFHIQKSLSTSRKLWTMAQIDAIINMDFSTQRSL